jgi:hypothetical protein
MLDVPTLSVIIVSVVMLNVIIMSVTMLSNVMSSVLILNIFMVNVMAPLEIKKMHKKHKFIIKTYKFEWSTREDFLKGKAQYGRPPYSISLSLTPFFTENIN